MNILIAPDKFKDALSASEICHFLEKGILQTFAKAKCTLLPLADGGEGTLESLNANLKGVFINLEVQNPLSEPVTASYLYIPQTQTAIIEMAQASGIELIAPERRNCLKTSSFGTGQLIQNAIQRGVKEIILTVGGTATNDAGMGIASALGFQFLAEDGTVLSPIGENLFHVASLDTSQISPALFDIKFTIATDVTNPFYGESGAAYVFARQKGADETAIAFLDKGLRNIAKILSKNFGKNPQELAGSGAGGGVAGGLSVLLNANIISAASWILEINQVSELLKNTDILITGEGKVDSQTWEGKLISQLLSKAEEKDIPVIIVCGTLQDVPAVVKLPAVLLATSILQSPITLENALVNTPQLVENQGMLLGKMLSKISLTQGKVSK
jgi:glycerate 2-kinase